MVNGLNPGLSVVFHVVLTLVMKWWALKSTVVDDEHVNNQGLLVSCF